MLEDNLIYSRIKPLLLNVTESNWDDLLGKPLYQRAGYQVENGVYSFGQLAGSFLGVPKAHEEYFDYLFDLVHDPNLKINLLSRDNLNKDISPEHFQAFQRIYLVHQKEQLTVNRLLAFLIGKEILPAFKNQGLNSHFQHALTLVFNKFKNAHPDGLLDPTFRRVAIDIIKWSWTYLVKWFANHPIEKQMPRIFWFGDGTKSNEYFLYLMLNLGCDLYIFHPEGKDILAAFSSDFQKIFKHSYPQQIEMKSFPEQKSRKATVAYRASKQLEGIIYDEDSIFYKAWQYRSHIPIPATLKTTYDEMYLVLKEEAFVRPFFAVENNEIRIPNIFTKVTGVSEDRNDYWQRINSISDYDLGITIKHFPFTKAAESKREYYHESLESNGILSPKKMISSKYWRYKSLSAGIQLALANAISRLCAKPKLKLNSNEKKLDIQLFLFSQAIILPDQYIRILQKFDYAHAVPRVLLYKNEKNGSLSRSDAVTLLLLNELGWDIIFYNPTRDKDLEVFIDENQIDVHMLDEIVFDYDFKEPSLLQRFLSNGIFKTVKEE